LSLADSTDITVAAGSTLALGTVEITSGKTLTLTPGSNISATHIRGGTLDIQGSAADDSAKVTINPSFPIPQGNNGGLSVLDGLHIANSGQPLVIPPEGVEDAIRTYFGTLDLGNNDLIIRNGNLAEIEDMIRAGRTVNFTWDGKGLTSSEASTGIYAGSVGLGVIRNDYGDGTPVWEEWGGVPVGINDILVKFTWYGDANLDGQVEGFDFALQAAGYTGDGSGWLFGDLDLSGGPIGGFDFALMGAGFTGSRVPGDPTFQQSLSLPEPGVLGLLAVGGLGLLRRRNRRA
jgi:hypothetical protein